MKYSILMNFEDIWSMSKSSIYGFQKAILVIKVKLGKKVFCKKADFIDDIHVLSFHFSTRSFTFFLVFYLHSNGPTFFWAGVMTQ